MAGASKSDLLHAVRRLTEAASSEGIGRAAAGKAMAIVEAVGPRDGHRSALGRAAASLRQAGLEGHFGAQAGRFLELLVECGRETAPAGELPLTDLLYVGHWTRRLLPDDGEARIPRMPPESPSGTAAVARRPGGRAGAPTAMELAMRRAEARRGAGR